MRARISTQWTGRDDLAEPSFVPNFAPRSLFRQKPVFGVMKSYGGASWKWGRGFICLGKIEIGFLKGRLVFKTRHFVNWRCCGENFFSFLFFFVAWHTFAEKHKCCHKIGIRSTNNNHLYSAILLRNNAITNSCFLFFAKTSFVTRGDQQAKTNEPVSSGRLFIRFSAPEWETFPNRSKHQALYLNRLLLFNDGPLCPIFRLDSRTPRIRGYIRK